jgi:uncharacterized protein with NRDE domain
MCLLVIAFRRHERLPLIVAGNRDEFHGRPAQDAHWWPDHPDVLGGRDLQAGGTWLAVHRNGRFATVTNYRDARKERAGLKSRGHLITGFLNGGESPLDYLKGIDGDDYAGFNLLVADPNAAAYLSNRGAAMRELPPGIYGLSNATLDEPWTKVTRSKASLKTLLDEDKVNATNLLRLLDDRDRASSDAVQANGLSFSMAHALTAPFIVLPEYGTRCSTVLTVSEEGGVHFVERRFNASGHSTGESSFAFDLAGVDGQ